MYYKQSTKDIRLVIMSFDDILFDLSKLRYNYYRRLCRLYNVTLDSNDFYRHMGSTRTMFENNPINQNLLSSDTLRNKIEDDLLEYMKLGHIQKKVGVDELLNYLAQKKIPFVLTTTQTQERTGALYIQANLYHQPDKFYYDDSSLEPLPSTDLYASILEDYQLDPSQVLLIASTSISMEAANKLKLNVLYVPGFEPTNDQTQIRCMTTASSLLDAINILIEGKDYTAYKPQCLLYKNNYSKEELINNYASLINFITPEYQQVMDTIYHEEKEYFYSLEHPVTKEVVVQEANDEVTQQVTLQKQEVIEEVEEEETVVEEIVEETIEKVEEVEEIKEDKKVEEVMTPTVINVSEKELDDMVDQVFDNSTATKQETPILNVLETALNNSEHSLSDIVEEVEEKQEEKEVVLNIVEDKKEETEQVIKSNPLDNLNDNISFNLDDLPSHTTEFKREEPKKAEMTTSLAEIIKEISGSSTPKSTYNPNVNELTKTKIFTKEELRSMGLNEYDLTSGEEPDDEIREKRPNLLVALIGNIFNSLLYTLMIGLAGSIAFIGLQDFLNDKRNFLYEVNLFLKDFTSVSRNLFAGLFTPLQNKFSITNELIGLLSILVLVFVIVYVVLAIASIAKRIRQARKKLA